MPLIILGLLVVAGLLAYMYFTGHSDTFIRKKKDPETKAAAKEEDSASVIYLPNDIEKEKRRRNVKTGK
ncbi:MAG: hypothetical protein HFE75_08380 [Firmicutes bacterium]|jgi:hypothetical protein|nr:hypothetical protein [Bacillota bacterium]NBI63638.1 hypothetical protein [Clostridiales bacterium]